MTKKRAAEAPATDVEEVATAERIDALPSPDVAEAAPAKPQVSEYEAHLHEYARRRRNASDLRIAASRVVSAPFRDEFSTALDALCRKRLEG